MTNFKSINPRPLALSQLHLYGSHAVGGNQGQLFNSSADGVWRTINGQHVLIRNGVITGGPAALKGKPFDAGSHSAVQPDLFGNASVDAIKGKTDSMFGENKIAPSASGVDAKIARQYDPSHTPETFAE